MLFRINRVVLLLFFLIAESRTLQVDLVPDDSFHIVKRNFAIAEFDVLNICEAEFDAVSFGEDYMDIAVVVGKYIYSRDGNDFVSIHQVYQLPEHLTKIDGYFMDGNNNEYLFMGQQLQVFSPINFTHWFTKTMELSTLTNDSTIQHIDAIFEYDGGLYVASGEKYWNLYWRNAMYRLRDFKGAKALLPLTTTFKGRNDTTYFVKGKRYYPIDAKKKEVQLSAGKSTRDLICSTDDRAASRRPIDPSCCLEQPRELVKELGPYALFRRYGMRKVELFNICETTFDAIAVARNRTFMFIGKYMYSSAQQEYMLIRDAYPALPENLTKIDAYLFLPNGFEYFYIGRKVYKIPNTESIPVSSVDLTALGFNSKIERVNAVFYYNKKLITISNGHYWISDSAGKVHTGPIDLRHLNGHSLQVTTGFGEFGGNAYIVHDGQYIIPVDMCHNRYSTPTPEDLVCQPRMFEHPSPPKCCVSRPNICYSDLFA